MAQRNILTIAFAFLILFSALVTAPVPVRAQGLTAGTVSGVVVDPLIQSLAIPARSTQIRTGDFDSTTFR